MDTKELLQPSKLKRLCSQYKLSPSKKYGQNYLVNSKPIAKMIELADVKKDDIIIEIGPGFGVLTFALLDKASKVYAFEIEKKLQEYWDKEIKRYRDKLEIVWGNILKFQIASLRSKKTDCRFTDYKVVANLPYQITSAVIRKFLESSNPPSEMVLMVQKEVAERICAKSGNMSLLAVSVQYYSKPEIVMQVPRAYFWPKPKVNSAVIKLSLYSLSLRGTKQSRLPLVDKRYRRDCFVPRNDRQILDDNKKRQFFKIVKAGFASKRKTLLNNLMALLGKDKKGNIVEILKKVGLSAKVRAEELSVNDWRELTRDIEI